MKIGKEISAVILSSGNSYRMNFPKAFLQFDEQRCFLEKIIETYIHCGINKIILVVNPLIYQRTIEIIVRNNYSSKVKLIINRFVERGRFYSIKLGLLHTESSFSFLQNIDNPFISVELLLSMIKTTEGSELVVPAFQSKEAHPILISRRITDIIIAQKGDDHNLKNVLSLFEKSILDWPDEKIVLNINTEEEYNQNFSQCKTSIAY